MAARKAVKQELTREIIMDAARELFVVKGYQSVSMRQIADKLGYSHGAIYYHFKNKAELFYALVKKDFSLLDEELSLLLQKEVADNQTMLENIFIGFIKFGLTHQSHYEIMFLTKEKELQHLQQEEPNVSYQKFAQAVHKYSSKKTTVSNIWSVFLALHGFVSHYCKSGQTYQDVEVLATSHAKLLVKIVS